MTNLLICISRQNQWNRNRTRDGQREGERHRSLHHVYRNRNKYGTRDGHWDIMRVPFPLYSFHIRQFRDFRLSALILHKRSHHGRLGFRIHRFLQIRCYPFQIQIQVRLYVLVIKFLLFFILLNFQNLAIVSKLRSLDIS